MFECDRCGSSFSASHLGLEHCPRCQLLDRVQVPLAFKAFRRLEPKRAAARSSAAGPAPAVAREPAEAA